MKFKFIGNCKTDKELSIDELEYNKIYKRSDFDHWLFMVINPDNNDCIPINFDDKNDICLMLFDIENQEISIGMFNKSKYGFTFIETDYEIFVGVLNEN
jgi:hypothetical protein